MPVYEFKCEEEHRWEIGVPIEDRDLEVLCPSCEGKGTRLFSAPGIEFKAKGFYTTDNRKIGK
jgi:putative FmdB family regulatory protein